MKIALIFFFLIAIKLNAQNEYSISIAPTKQNVLYYGIYNPLSAAVSGVKENEIELKASDSSQIKYDAYSKEYAIFPNSKSDTISIDIYSKNKSQIIHYGSRTFRIKILPTPTPYILNNPISTNNIPIDSISAIDQLKLAEVNLDFVVSIRPKEFYLKIHGRSYFSNSKDLTVQMKSALASVQRGEKIIFEKIKAYLPDGSVRFTNDLLVEFY